MKSIIEGIFILMEDVEVIVVFAIDAWKLCYVSSQNARYVEESLMKRRLITSNLTDILINIVYRNIR
jgi:hypothetical protein